MAEQEKDKVTKAAEEAVEGAAEDTAAADETEAVCNDSAETQAAEASEEAAEAAGEGEDAKTWAEKRAAKKQAKQDKKADIYKEQIAEFENFRNRTEKEKQAMFEIGAKSVIEKILPIIDNFERGFATVDPSDEEDAFVGGMRMVYKQLMTELENIGVTPIEAVGLEFDPNLHNAVMQVQSEEYESGIVAQELQKGYTYRGNVVRYSMVAVVE